MADNPILMSGVSGMQQGLRSMRDVAQDIAELNIADNPSSTDGETAERSVDQLQDVATAIVDLKLYQRQVQASAQVVKTADEVLGFLLDVRA